MGLSSRETQFMSRETDGHRIQQIMTRNTQRLATNFMEAVGISWWETPPSLISYSKPRWHILVHQMISWETQLMRRAHYFLVSREENSVSRGVISHLSGTVVDWREPAVWRYARDIFNWASFEWLAIQSDLQTILTKRLNSSACCASFGKIHVSAIGLLFYKP